MKAQYLNPSGGDSPSEFLCDLFFCTHLQSNILEAFAFEEIGNPVSERPVVAIQPHYSISESFLARPTTSRASTTRPVATTNQPMRLSERISPRREGRGLSTEIAGRTENSKSRWGYCWRKTIPTKCRVIRRRDRKLALAAALVTQLASWASGDGSVEPYCPFTRRL